MTPVSAARSVYSRLAFVQGPDVAERTAARAPALLHTGAHRDNLHVANVDDPQHRRRRRVDHRGRHGNQPPWLSSADADNSRYSQSLATTQDPRLESRESRNGVAFRARS